MKSFFSKKKLKFPAISQWKQVLKVLNKKEKKSLAFLLILFLGSLSFLLINFYWQNTEIQAKAGGEYMEGLIGQPRFLNPIYAPANDVDRDLIELIFSGLMKYDGNGKIIPDLAKEQPKISEDGKVYEFYLKENIFWQDGEPLMADDVVFTIKTIQNSDYKSPIRANFLGVSVEKISKLGVRFTLKNSYVPFLERTTIKILPKHIWEQIPPENFLLANFNLQPIGSGPYKIDKLEKNSFGKIKSLSLRKNSDYFGKKPNISKIDFLFFDNNKELAEAAEQGKIKGLSSASQILETKFKNYSIILPRYFAIFFNPQKSKFLSDKKIREALNYGTDREELIKEVFGENQPVAEIVNSPILPKIYGFQPPAVQYEFDIEKAKSLLESAGFKDENGKRIKTIEKEPAFQFKSKLKKGSQGKEVRKLQECLAKDKNVYPEGEISGMFGSLTKKAVIRFQEKYKKDILEPWGFKKGTGLVSKTTRAKLNEICFETPKETLDLKFSLIAPNQGQLIKVAENLKKQWGKLGIEIKIETKSPSQIEKEIIKPRDYEMLLFGQVLESIPDPFPFWHSSQKRDPGLNLALYENKTADDLLKKARQAPDIQTLTENLQKFQDVLIKDAPAVFLYSPNYIYSVSKEVKGINLKMIVKPSKRFSQIENWYIKTKRAWK